MKVADDLLRKCYLSVAASDPMPYDYSGVGTLLRIVDFLATKAIQSDGTLPLLVFLTRLTASIANSTVQTILRSWVENIATTVQIDKEKLFQSIEGPAPSIPASIFAYLLVKIEPSLWGEQDSFLVTGWLSSNGRFDKLPTPDDPVSSQKLSHCLDMLIGESHQRLISKDAELVIELFAPRSTFELAFDQWRVKVGRNMYFPIGAKYLTLIRSYERVYDPEMRPTWGFWNEKWTASLKLSDISPKTHIMFCREEDCKGRDIFYLQLLESPIICLVFTFRLPKKSGISDWDIIDTTLNAGTPIAVWLRQYTDGSVHLLEEIRSLLLEYPLSNLPKLIMHKRRDAIRSQNEQHPGYHLALLWDDPQRLPPDVLPSYRAPDE